MSYKLSGSSFPCSKVVEAVNPQMSYAVLREPLSDGRTILSPLAEVPGIEDPRLLAPEAPNYFALAWNERQLVVPQGKDGREAVVLAINAAMNRTQDRLHIHIGCAVPEVSEALAAAVVSESQFRRLNVRLYRQIYWAQFVVAQDLSAINPIKLVADGVPLARRDMGGVTIGVISAERGGRTS
jgi:CDP-diacylglycerol pyrophosphatase